MEGARTNEIVSCVPGGYAGACSPPLPSCRERRKRATKLRKADHVERESECGNEQCGAQMRIQVSALENQAGPDRTDRSVTCRRGGGCRGEEGGERRGEDAPGGTKRGEEEGHALPGLKQGERDGRVAAAATASSARAAAAVPRERRSARRSAVRRTQSPPAATPTDSDSLAPSSRAPPHYLE